MNRTVVTSYIVRCCPKCQIPYHIPLESGVAFGSRWWSDGLIEHPFQPQIPMLFPCNSCDTIVYFSDLIDPQIMAEDMPGIIRNSDPIVKLTEAKAHEILKLPSEEMQQRVSSSITENTLRVYAWKAGNNQFRTGIPDTSVCNTTRRNNMYRLLDLESERPCGGCVQCLCERIEIYRNLGDFNRAIKECSNMAEPGIEYYALFQQTMCERKITETVNVNAVRFGPGCV